MQITIKEVTGSDNIAIAHAIRKEVFQDEQAISSKDDFDGRDDAATQFLAFDSDKPIGTARYRVVEDSSAKIERVAVFKPYRGHSVGRLIIEELIDSIQRHDIHHAYLEAQSYASPFYEKLGFKIVGEEFEAVGIPTLKMEINL